ncbi:MAG: ATP-grasp fold amidoligase family protein [Bryobacteraceae bacterium]
MRLARPLLQPLLSWVKKPIKKALPDSVVEWMIDSRCLIHRYWKGHGVFPRLIRPRTFNEKVIHRMLFDRRDLLTQMTDKAAARSYVGSRLGPQILPKLYCLTTRPEDIPFDELPDRFVVKPTHGSGWVQVVTDRSTLDRGALMETCNGWLGRSYYEEGRVWFYKNIEPRIMVEEFIDDGSGAVPNDYKLFVFDGAVEFIQVDVGRFIGHWRRLYTPAWEKLDVFNNQFLLAGDLPRPPHLAELLAAAETLGRGIDFVRVDFYDTREHIFFGELTMAPGGGTAAFTPKEYDYYLGSLWKLPARWR